MTDTDQPGVDRDTLARVIVEAVAGAGNPYGGPDGAAYARADAVLAHLDAHTPPAPTTSPDPLREDLAPFVEIDPTWTPGTLTRTERQAWAAGFRAAQRLVAAALDAGPTTPPGSLRERIEAYGDHNTPRHRLFGSTASARDAAGDQR